MSKIKNIIIAAVMLVGFFATPAMVFAEVTTPNYVPNSVSNATKVVANGNLNAFLSNILDLLVAAAGLIALAFLILGGIKYVTSGGDASKAEGARKQVIAALIGLVIVIASFILLHLVLTVIGGSNNGLQVPCVVQPSGQAGVIGSDGTCIPSSAQQGS